MANNKRNETMATWFHHLVVSAQDNILNFVGSFKQHGIKHG